MKQQFLRYRLLLVCAILCMAAHAQDLSVARQLKSMTDNGNYGYPLLSSAGYKALSTVINKGKDATVDEIKEAMGKYYMETNVKMPAAGKWYRIAGVNDGGSIAYLTYANQKVELKSSYTSADAFLAVAGNGGLEFKTKDERFLTVLGNPSGFEGFTYPQSGKATQLTVSKLVVENADSTKLIGKFSISGWLGRDGNDEDLGNSTAAISYPSNAIVASPTAATYFTSGTSSAFIFEETTEPVDPATSIQAELTFDNGSNGIEIENAGDPVTLVVHNVQSADIINASLPYFEKQNQISDPERITSNSPILTKVENSFYNFNVNTSGLEAGQYLLYIPAETFSYVPTSDYASVESTLATLSITIKGSSVNPGGGDDPNPGGGDDPNPSGGESGQGSTDTDKPNFSYDYRFNVSTKMLMDPDVHADVVADVWLNDIVFYTDLYTSIVPNPDAVIQITNINGALIKTGHLTSYSNFRKEMPYPWLNGYIALKLVLDEPFQQDELKYLSGMYYVVVPREALGDANFGKWLKNNSFTGQCLVNEQKSYPFALNNKIIDILGIDEDNPGGETTCSLSIKSTGNGSVIYNNTATKNTTKSFTVNYGTSAPLTISPDTGYKLGKLTVNGTDVTSSVKNNSYTVNNITNNTNVVASFEEISTGVDINSTTFPDEAFRTWVLNNISGASDGVLTTDEIAKVTTIDCSGTSSSPGNIRNMKGIEYFTVLKLLYCNNNKITELDVSMNTTLTLLSCSSNQLTTLDVSKNTALTSLFCYSNQLTTLDVSKNTALTSLSCYSNQLTTLDVSKNTALKSLFCSSNQLTTLEVTKNTALTDLSCSSNQLTALDVTKNTALTWLYCFSNQLLFLDLSNNNSISDANTRISTQYIPLTAIDISSGIAIPVPAGFNMAKVSNLKLNGTSVSGSVTTVNGQKYLVFATKGTTQSSINGKTLTYTYSTDNSFSKAAAMDVSVTLSYTATTVNYSLSIQSDSGGSISYNGSTITNTTRSFTVEQGASATITISLDTGYKLSMLTVNGTDVTSSVWNNTYTISNITENTSIVATFTPLTYSLSIKATGSGSVTFNNLATRNTTRTFTMDYGSSATLSITPDKGYQLNQLMVNGVDVTSGMTSGEYTIYDITEDISVIASFEQIPANNYTLSIQAEEGGTLTYNGTSISGSARNFSVEKGTTATISISPDTGYRLSRLTVNGTDVTSAVWNNSYTVSNITGNTSIVATFTPLTYTLSIKATGNGSIVYNSTATKNTTKTFTVEHGSSATLTISPDTGYRLSMLKVNGTDVTASASTGKYTVENITANTTIEATFEQTPADVTVFSVGGLKFTVSSNNQVLLSANSYQGVVTVPETVAYQGKSWSIVGTEAGVFDNGVAAIIWKPLCSLEYSAFASLNPNLLLYVENIGYAPREIRNVVSNGAATTIMLTDATSGNEFYCPEEFTAQHISYSHHYGMTSGLGISQGWETIALPFDVQKILHSSKGDIVPFKKLKTGNEGKPFWLMELTSQGFVEAEAIKANTPYIISMPNNNAYLDEFRLVGAVTFSADNVRVRKSDAVNKAMYGDRTLVPNYAVRSKETGVYALNVKNDYVTYSGSVTEGSRFIVNLRTVHPFEAYMTSESLAKESFGIFEEMITDISELESLRAADNELIYNLQGQRVTTVGRGVYIINGKKKAVK